MKVEEIKPDEIKTEPIVPSVEKKDSVVHHPEDLNKNTTEGSAVSPAKEETSTEAKVQNEKETDLLKTEQSEGPEQKENSLQPDAAPSVEKYSEQDFQKSRNSRTAQLFQKHGNLLEDPPPKKADKTQSQKEGKKFSLTCLFCCCCKKESKN